MSEPSQFRLDMAHHFPFVIQAIAVPNTLRCDTIRPLKPGEAKWLIEKAAKTPDHYTLMREIGTHLNLWGRDEEPTATSLQRIQHWGALETMIKHLGEPQVHAMNVEGRTHPKSPEQLQKETLTYRYHQIKLRLQGLDNEILDPYDPDYQLCLGTLEDAIIDLDELNFRLGIQQLQKTLQIKTESTWILTCH